MFRFTKILLVSLLRAGSLLTWSDTQGNGQVLVSAWAFQCPYLDFKLVCYILSFTPSNVFPALRWRLWNLLSKAGISIPRALIQGRSWLFLFASLPQSVYICMLETRWQFASLPFFLLMATFESRQTLDSDKNISQASFMARSGNIFVALYAWHFRKSTFQLSFSKMLSPSPLNPRFNGIVCFINL